MASIEDKLAAEEASDMTEEERKYYEGALASLKGDQRGKMEKDPFDLLIIVRGFQTEVPRMEETCKAIKVIADWRDKVDAYNFFKQRIARDEEFHKCWPEKLYGTDKYGHMVIGVKISEIDCDGLEKFDEGEIEKLQGQKLKAVMVMKYDRYVATGVRRYKHTAILDLTGAGMSLLSGKKRAILKRVADIGTHYYPETAWKIYLINAPFVFRAIWTVVKPWLHPITAAKINILGQAPEVTMMEQGIPRESLPDWAGGTNKGMPVFNEVLELCSEQREHGASKPK